MKMQLIQPFLSAADSVFAEALAGSTKIGDLTMEEDGYREKGTTAVITIRGEIEGRLILDMEPATAVRVASALAGREVAPSEQIVNETVAELANMVIGNAATLLNDLGHEFKVYPPEIHAGGEVVRGSAETETMAVYFDTPSGRIFLNIAMRYSLRPAEHAARVQG